MTSFEDAARKIEDVKDDIKSETEDALEDGMDSVKWALRAELKKQGSVASGNLWQSLFTISPSAERGYATTKIIGAPYWKYLEFGTGIYTSRGYRAPSQPPPYEPIYRWVVQKGLTPDPTGSANTQEQLAYAIQQSIPTGTEQHKFARPVWRGPRGKVVVENEIERAITRAIRKNI